jgi:hypothetical protein
MTLMLRRFSRFSETAQKAPHPARSGSSHPSLPTPPRGGRQLGRAKVRPLGSNANVFVTAKADISNEQKSGHF